MARPEVPTVTEEAYAGLLHNTDGDEARGWPLLVFVNSLARQLAEIEALVRDTETHEGWGILLDREETPATALEYVAQFVGATLDRVLTEEQKRQEMIDRPRHARGTVPALIAAVQPFLKGTKRVEVIERDGHPYRIRVRVYQAEIGGDTYDDLGGKYQTYDAMTATGLTYDDLGGNAGKAEAAAHEAKAGGLVLTFEIAAGATYDQLSEEFPTYDALSAAFADYDEMTNYVPTV